MTHYDVADAIPNWGVWGTLRHVIEGPVKGHRNRGIDVTLPPYSAVGDGVTDDTAAFAAAIADLNASGTLFLPPEATFLIDSVAITKPMTIYAYGATIITDGSYMLQPGADRVTIKGAKFTDTGGGVHVLKNNLTSGAYTRWKFEDCIFDATTLRFEKIGRDDGTGTMQTTGSAIASHVKVVDCEFFGYAGNYTLELAGVTDCIVRGADIHDCGVDVNQGDGIKVLHGAERVLIDGGTIDTPTRDCIDVYNGNRVTIRGVTLLSAGAQAVDAKWLSTSTVETGFLKVIGNQAEGCAAGFNVDTKRALIIGNICERSGAYGFRASQSVDGAPVATEYVSFVGNLADSNTTDGFVFSNGDNFVLSANQSIGNGGFGYSKGVAVGVLGDATDNVADGNTSGGFNGFS